MSEESHTLVAAYALDAVDDLERAVVERHLAACPACADEVVELRASAARLADPVAATPPPGLRASVLAAARRTRQLPPVVAATQARPARVQRWRRWSAAAAAAGLIAAGASAATYAATERRTRAANETAAAERSAADAARARADRISAILTAPDAVVRTAEVQGGGRVTVVASDRADAAVVSTAGLTDLGPSRTYQLWLIAGDDATPAGFAPPGDQSVVVDHVAAAEHVGLSTEPAGGSARPSRVVASVTLT